MQHISPSMPAAARRVGRVRNRASRSSRLLAWARALGERRRARLLLSSMSDRELKDIGLVRSHIETIVRMPRR